MSRRKRRSTAVATLVAEILRHGRELPTPLTALEIAKRVGVAPETLSRMKREGRGEIAVVSEMAAVVGLRLKLVGLDDQAERLRSGEFFDD